MRRREVITLFGVAAAAWPLAARGQQSGERRRRIGVLTPGPAQFNSEALLRALEQRGHKEGVNLVLAVASAEGRLDRLTSLAEEMSRGEFDVVVTVNTPATRAILAVPGTAPVVMAMVSDPIVLGFVDNLSRPTGRVTGVANMIHDLAQKRLALLKEAAPAVRRVAALFHPDDPINEPQRRQIAQAAPSLGLEVSFLPVREAKEVESAFREALASRADAFFVVAGQSRRDRRASRRALPAPSRSGRGPAPRARQVGRAHVLFRGRGRPLGTGCGPDRPAPSRSEPCPNPG